MKPDKWSILLTTWITISLILLGCSGDPTSSAISPIDPDSPPTMTSTSVVSIPKPSTSTPIPTLSSTVVPQSEPTIDPWTVPPFEPEISRKTLGNLTLVNYRLVAEELFADLAGNDEQRNAFYVNIPEDILDGQDSRLGRSRLEDDQEITITQVNQVVGLYGYEFAEEGCEGGWCTYQLYQDGNLIEDGIPGFWQFEINPAGTNFALLYYSSSRDLCMLSKDPPRCLTFSGAGYDWHAWVDPAFFIGNNLVSLVHAGGIIIFQDVERIYDQQFSYTGPMNCPIEAFFPWANEWVLEAEQQVIINGEELNDTYGYEKVFNWRPLLGEPFYFFQEEGKYGISFDGQHLPMEYDEVLTTGCGADIYSAPLGPITGSHGVGFFARYDGYWHYVEIGDFN